MMSNKKIRKVLKTIPRLSKDEKYGGDEELIYKKKRRISNE